MIQIGDIEIHIINDVEAMVDPGGVFGLVPRMLWSRYAQPNDNHLIPMHHNCLLVRVGGKTIVIETGPGDKMGERRGKLMGLRTPFGQLIPGLAKLGVQPEDVDIVIDTHLHSDHCGGNTRLVDDEIVPTFPNAEYIVQRREYQDALFPNERTRGTYFDMNYKGLVESGQMRLIEGETEIITGIRCVPTPGHTPGHQSVILESGSESAFYVGDLSTMAVHFERLAWMTAYDVEPLITLESKRHWQQWAIKNDPLLIFVHEPTIPVGRYVQDGKKYKVVPASE